MAPFKGENPVGSVFARCYERSTSSHIVEVLRRIRHMITPLPMNEQESRLIKYTGPEPDFLAAISPRCHSDYLNGVPLKESVFMDNWPNFDRLRSVFKFPSQLGSADSRDIPGLVASQLCYFLQEYPGFFLRTWVSLLLLFL